MKILFSIILNGSILFAISYFLNTPSHPDSIVVSPTWVESWKIYLLGWVILWLLNSTVKPLLKILWLTLFFIYPIVLLVINIFILWLLQWIINDLLTINWFSYQINWITNYIIAVAIFVIMNMLYGILFSKK